MKLFLLTLLLSITSFSVFSQEATTLTANEKIYEWYPASKIEILLATEPQTIVYWNAIYDYGFKIIEPTKNIDATTLKEVEIKDLENVNILALNIIPNDKPQYFRIKGSDKILLLRPENFIKNKIKTVTK